MRNRHLLSCLLAGAAASVAFAAPAQAQRVDRIIAFGDSYADDDNAVTLLLASPFVPQATKDQLLQVYSTGRFSGGTHGFCVGHVAPEAAVGGPIALVRDGDTIEVGGVPVRLTDTLAFMLETRYPQHVTSYAAGLETLQPDYVDCWHGLDKRFTGRP